MARGIAAAFCSKYGKVGIITILSMAACDFKKAQMCKKQQKYISG